MSSSSRSTKSTGVNSCSSAGDNDDGIFEPAVIKEFEKEAKERFTTHYELHLPPGRIGTTAVATTSSNSINLNKTTAASRVAPLHEIKIPVTTPPGWQYCYDKALKSNSQFESFPVDPKSFEFKTIVELMEPYKVVSVQKVCNRQLWKSYTTRRANLLQKKCGDPKILYTLGMNQVEVEARIERDKKFFTDPVLTSEKGSYSLNEALLFHCTLLSKNVQHILEQGLDERLGTRSSVCLGPGIYFSDDPRKSCTYVGDSNTLIIFTVILGDCVDMDKDRVTAFNLKREPQKLRQQMRSDDDLFFESVVARPAKIPYNEYVIYQRDQCCPLYEVKLCPNSIELVRVSSVEMSIAVGHKNYELARASVPNFAWNKQISYPYYMPNQENTLDWCFLASEIFKKMDIGCNMLKLKDMGFQDEQMNEAALLKYENNLDAASNFLLGKNDIDENQEPILKKKKMSSASSTTLNCAVCMVEYLYKSDNFGKLKKCGHEMCLDCLGKIRKSGKTMSEKIECSWTKCPICNDIDGVEIGSCPDGVKTVELIQTPCAGYEGYETYKISYNIQYEGQFYKLVCYVPAVTKGVKVVKLLDEAWEKRQCFTIGESISRGLQNVIKWNIHFKTSLSGGFSNHGFPDEKYLDTVLDELKRIGIS